MAWARTSSRRCGGAGTSSPGRSRASSCPWTAFRGQAGRCRRPLPRSAGTGAGAVRRREVPDPSTQPAASRRRLSRVQTPESPGGGHTTPARRTRPHQVSRTPSTRRRRARCARPGPWEAKSESSRANWISASSSLTNLTKSTDTSAMMIGVEVVVRLADRRSARALATLHRRPPTPAMRTSFRRTPLR